MTSNGDFPRANHKNLDDSLVQRTPLLEEELMHVLQHAIERVRRHKQSAPFDMRGVTVFNEHRNLVFRLASSPGVIFKTRIWEETQALGSDMQTRMAHGESGRRVIARLDLFRLYIPRSELFHLPLFGKPRTFLAEEELPICHEDSVLGEEFEQLCVQREPAFLEAIEQLMWFIIHTGFDDLEFHNIPPLRNEDEPLRLAIIDLEHMDSVIRGLAGEEGYRRGLLQCLSPELALEMVASLERQGVPFDKAEVERALKAREAEWGRLQALRHFHLERGITGRESLQIDPEAMGIDVADRESLLFFVSLLNQKLQEANTRETTAAQRHLFLSWYEIRQHLPRFGGVEEARRRIFLFFKVLAEHGVIFDVQPWQQASFWIQV